jgi:hypothetical protein
MKKITIYKSPLRSGKFKVYVHLLNLQVHPALAPSVCFHLAHRKTALVANPQNTVPLGQTQTPLATEDHQRMACDLQHQCNLKI